MKRCDWCLKDQLYIDYHDNVWGVPEFDDQKLFEYLNLEGAQAGLSWYTILKKKDNYSKAFSNWDAKKIASFSDKKIDKLLQNPGIIRNKLKVNAVVTNAKLYLNMLDEGLTLKDYLWNFVDGKPIINNWKTINQIPAETALSKKISKDLKKKGFKFVGPTIIYAYMQAIGMVDDHISSCFKKR
ncbi:MAG: DNA-3-methyladenine glycosylase I [Saprospiraceae bacterium]|nr:DNA-3-methyladenine glycosylase I [Bacteroidia bacterium]NNE15271.1 DNA-3-methyladenine glycosylase I [Saprospiraceae bacterium]NNL93127.1 DNA-3-methyladenine glycosylase I [Saprospiraceae bacterium]